MTILDHLTAVHGYQPSSDMGPVRLEGVHRELHVAGHEHEPHRLLLDRLEGDDLHSHLVVTHDDPPDGSWGEEEWIELHLTLHQRPDDWSPDAFTHEHQGMVCFPYPVEQLVDHLTLTHLDKMYAGQPRDRVFDNIVGHHEKLHRDSTKGVPHEHRLDGTHLVEVGHRVGDPIPQPVRVHDYGTELPEIDLFNRRMVLIAAGEIEGAIAAQRRLDAAEEARKRANQDAERAQTDMAQRLRVLERLAIHPKHCLPLLTEEDRAYFTAGWNANEGPSLYVAIEDLVDKQARQVLGQPPPTDPDDEKAPGWPVRDGG